MAKKYNNKKTQTSKIRNRKKSSTLTSAKKLKTKLPNNNSIDFEKWIENFLVRMNQTKNIISETLLKIINAPIIIIRTCLKYSLKFLTFLISILKISTNSVSKFIKDFFSILAKLLIPILFGFLAGGAGAVFIYILLGYNESDKSAINFQKEINIKISDIENDAKLIATHKNDIKNLKDNIIKIQDVINLMDENLLIHNNNFKEIEKFNEQIIALNRKIQNISTKVDKNSRLMTSASESELTTRLHLAFNLVDRLTSGVPYAPTLEALGPDAADPFLLRFAKGGAPTLADLAARLSGRAGEVRDADKTLRDSNWRENMSNKISGMIKIRPTDIDTIKGTKGALLRAELAITNGNLNKAINEIESLDPKTRGPLSAWLVEATAKQRADIAANNILAKATAALGNTN